MKTLTMKAKKIFLLTAIMLGSASAMAQNGNNGTLNGDVNSDGTIDVADIVAVIDLIQKGQEEVEAGYFYLGTTQPMATNFTSLPGLVTTYTSIDEAVGTSVTVSEGETLYMLCPTSWTKEKNVVVENKNGETVIFLEDVDNVTISGYSIYKTQVWNTSSTATLKTIVDKYYYIYFGPELDTYTPPVNESDFKTVPTYKQQINIQAGWYRFNTNTTEINNFLGNYSTPYWYIIWFNEFNLRNDYDDLTIPRGIQNININNESYKKWKCPDSIFLYTFKK